MTLLKGQPKSLYLPGSSVDVLIFQKDRVAFSEDIRKNALRYGVSSRYSSFFGRPVVETDVRVRSTVAEKVTLNT
jgi:phosphatidylserine decarboxylase